MRPIAVGETLRRLVAKWLAGTEEARRLAGGLMPTQVAFQKGGPCQVTAAGFQEVLRDLRTGDWGVLQVDMANAFNTVSWEVVVERMKSLAPGLLTWVTASLQAAPMICGGAVLWSTAGVQQGDLLGPLLFATALGKVVEGIPGRTVLNAWYLGDGTVLEPTPVLEQVVVYLSGAAINASPS